MLAIIIPYYKLTFFEATLQSLANQTDKRFRVYIGDDASNDNPILLLQQFQGQFEFSYHRFETNLGSISLVQQWQRCIAMSDDEKWLMILGDDDVLGDNVVASFYENLIHFERNIKVVRYASCKINDDGKETSKVYLNPEIELSTDFLFRETRSSLSEYVFQKEQIKKVGFKNLPLAWFSDILAVLEFSNFKKVYSINQAITYIRITEKSISGIQSNSKEKLKATFKFYYYLLSTHGNRFDNEQFKKLLNKLSKCFLDDKRNVINFLRVTSVYAFNFLLIDYLYFIKSIYNNFKKNASRL